ncbi:MAG: hypothetical protein DRI44_02785 [Chlamydiae bacterium]|nr:MAG: hypothetical protein DRI44_02785 [Chlamydiota bacterium]
MKTYVLSFLLIFAFGYNISAKKIEVKKDNHLHSEVKKQMISLAKFKGSVLVLYFFGDNMDNWNRSIAQLNRLKTQFKDKNVYIGAVTSKTKEEIDEYMKTIDFIMFAKSIDFAVATDSDSAKKYKVKPPYVYVIAQDGRIYWKSKSFNNIQIKINDLIEKSVNAQNKGTNVYNEKLTGDVTHFKNTTPKLNLDDSRGLADPGVKEGTTFYKENKPAQPTPATEESELSEDTHDTIPVQSIEEYKGTPGIKETDRKYQERSDMNLNDD